MGCSSETSMKSGQNSTTEKSDSLRISNLRGGLEVLPYFPAHGREGEAAPLLRRNLLILLVQVAILMASRTLAKSQPFWQSTWCAAERSRDTASLCGLTGFVADRRLIIWRRTFEPISNYGLR